jgi:hypothetical protein
MVTIKCDECGRYYETTFSKCPFCELSALKKESSGTPPPQEATKEPSYWTQEVPKGKATRLIFTAIAFIAILNVVNFCSSRTSRDSNHENEGRSPSIAAQSTSTIPKTEAQLRQERIEKQFSLWDGSHRTLEKMVKDSMNDPASYEHVETRYIDQGDRILVTTVYRGKNAFNATIRNKTIASFDITSGALIEVVYSGP